MKTLISLFLFSTLPLAAQFELSGSELAKLEQGIQLTKETKIPNEVWPRYNIYQVINASPETVFATFVDYNNAQNYIPNVISSKIIQRHSKNDTVVRYEVKLPIIKNEVYTTRNSATKVGNNYRIAWSILQSTNASAGSGSLTITPFKGQTLIQYNNHISPNLAPLAKLLKTPALTQLKQVVSSLKKASELND